MQVTLSLSEVMDRCKDWEELCDAEGLNPWACKEGFGDSQITFTEEKAKKYGILAQGQLHGKEAVYE